MVGEWLSKDGTGLERDATFPAFVLHVDHEASHEKNWMETHQDSFSFFLLVYAPSGETHLSSELLLIIILLVNIRLSSGTFNTAPR